MIGATITTEEHTYRLDGWNVRVTDRDAENYGRWMFTGDEREQYEAMDLRERFEYVLGRVEHIEQVAV